MRISDWSSDVCSSDLRLAVGYSSSLMAGNLKQTFSEYLTRFPDVQFDGEEAAPEKLLNSLQSRTIDVAVAPAGMEESGILARSVWSDRLMVARSEEHTSELQSLMRISYAVFCLKKKKNRNN